jgi:hypothetical protein
MKLNQMALIITDVIGTVDMFEKYFSGSAALRAHRSILRWRS